MAALNLTNIGIGSSANDGTGDTLRAGATTVNANNALVETSVNDKHSLHHTTGHPANTVGENEDWCINDTTGELVGPKAAGAWPATTTGYTGLTFAEVFDDKTPGLGGNLGVNGFHFTVGASGSDRLFQFVLTDTGAGFHFETGDDVDNTEVILKAFAKTAANDVDLIIRAGDDPASSLTGRVKIDDLQNESGDAYAIDGQTNQPALARHSGGIAVSATSTPATLIEMDELDIDGNGAWAIDTAKWLRCDVAGDYLMEIDLVVQNTDAGNPAQLRILLYADSAGGDPQTAGALIATPRESTITIPAKDADHASERSVLTYKRVFTIGGTAPGDSAVGTTIAITGLKDATPTATPTVVGAESYVKITRIGPATNIEL